MNSVLVTGASGFIGRHLVRRFERDGHPVLEAPRAAGDVAQDATWRRYPKADVVVHLAARSFVPESWEVPGSFLETNLLGAANALQYCRRHGARLVFPSSYLYGNSGGRPIPETAPLVASNPYGLSKKLAEEACAFFADRCGVAVTILRPFNIYGPGQGEAFLVPTVLSQIRAGREIRVKDLTPRRDWVYVADVVDAVAKASAPAQGLRVFNVGSGASHSVAELIRTIQQVWQTSLPVHSDDERRPSEVMDSVADITHAERELGWRPQFTLRQGLEDWRGAS